jgi:hypothetical protein
MGSLGVISMEDGTLGLEMVLGGTLHVVVAIPKAEISLLHECLLPME